ncbi:N-6 DNA methylase [Streptomyces sp. NPDC006510]|uniref:N-6 DNA methylase n=1 Tax=Streptomyces sp. NPDC006510 TaxID=3155600 RepID=UPI0033AC10CB
MNVDTMRRLLLAEEDAGRLKSGTKVERESCPGRACRLTRVKTCLEAQLALVSAEMATFTEVRFLYLADGSSRPLYDNYQEREALAIPAIAAALFTGGPDNNIGLGYMSDYRKIVKLLDANTGAARMSQVFEDFVEMAALAIRNAVDYCGRDKREAQYLRTAGRYDRASLNRFAQALALVIEEMDRDPCDVLGRLYMELEIGNERLGQFYTPYDVAELMAQMQIESVIEHVQTHGFADLYEPACGASSFSVAVSQAMLEHGLNPQTQLHVTAEDIAPQAIHMIYIHLTLLHIPAVVQRRDTLTLRTFDSWPTPAHVLGGWGQKLRLVQSVGGAQKLLSRALQDSAESRCTRRHAA